MRVFLTLLILTFSVIAPNLARAQDVDLILPPALVTADAPFYRGAQVKMGNVLMPVNEGALPNGKLAQYQPETKTVVVSNDKTSSEVAKGQALMDVVAALQANDIATAAGQ